MTAGIVRRTVVDVSTAQILLLGAAAGFTIFLGLPIGRIRDPKPRLKAFLNALAVGVLVFLLYDILTHAIEPVESSLTAAKEDGSWATFAQLSAIFVVGLGVGLLSLVYYDRWMTRRAHAEPRFGPGAAAVAEMKTKARAGKSLTAAQRLSLLIALGIGLHNFSEGLSIGQSAANGEITLALMLIIGFGLHNATEGFGIVAPLTNDDARPTWGFLLLMGLIGGGPTFVGTVIGQAVVSDYLSVAFLALAAGSILYVIVQLLHVADKLGFKELLMWGILLGFLAGLATDFVLVAAGA